MSIVIRRAEPTDAQAVKKIYEGENAYSGTLQLPFPSLDLWDKRLSTIPDNVYVFVALIDDEIVGNLGFETCVNPRRRHVASFGMGVKDAFVDQGVGRALLKAAIELSDNWLNLKRIELTVYKDNERAISLYKSLGFEIEGESPAYAFRNGEYVTAYYMARLKN